MEGYILIVEDDFFVAEEMQQYLEKLGYTATTAESGEEAIVSAREKMPEGILMDVQLAGRLDGVDTVREMRRFCQAPVIFLTANESEETYDRCEAVENSFFLPKPVSQLQLKRLIQQVFLQKEGSITFSEGELPQTAGAMLDSIFLRSESSREKYTRVKLADITHLKSERSYCRLYLKDGSQYIESHPLKVVLAKILGKHHHDKFIRVHKSYAVNSDFIKAYEGNELILEGAHRIPIGPNYRDNIKPLFG